MTPKGFREYGTVSQGIWQLWNQQGCSERLAGPPLLGDISSGAFVHGISIGSIFEVPERTESKEFQTILVWQHLRVPAFRRYKPWLALKALTAPSELYDYHKPEMRNVVEPTLFKTGS